MSIAIQHDHIVSNIASPFTLTWLL